jgi:predicted Zn-dependent protease
LEAYPEMLSPDSPVSRNLRRIALSSYIETRNIRRAKALVEQLIDDDSERPSLLLKKASLLALEAQYEAASQILLDLNRSHPGQAAIQKRLVLVFEQVRDIGKAAAFLKAYVRQVPGDPWAAKKQEMFEAVGIR